VEAVPDGQAAVDIQLVKWAGSPIAPRIQVLIDRTYVGFVTDQHVRSFPVAPGFHKVKVKSLGVDSETMDLSISLGDRVTL
jgi:hypothetical protein